MQSSDAPLWQRSRALTVCIDPLTRAVCHHGLAAAATLPQQRRPNATGQCAHNHMPATSPAPLSVCDKGPGPPQGEPRPASPPTSLSASGWLRRPPRVPPRVLARPHPQAHVHLPGHMPAPRLAPPDLACSLQQGRGAPDGRARAAGPARPAATPRHEPGAAEEPHAGRVLVRRRRLGRAACGQGRAGQGQQRLHRPQPPPAPRLARRLPPASLSHAPASLRP